MSEKSLWVVVCRVGLVSSGREDPARWGGISSAELFGTGTGGATIADDSSVEGADAREVPPSEGAVVAVGPPASGASAPEPVLILVSSSPVLDRSGSTFEAVGEIDLGVATLGRCADESDGVFAVVADFTASAIFDGRPAAERAVGFFLEGEATFGEASRFAPEDEEAVEAESVVDLAESPGAAAAIPGLLASAAPTPSATASAPIRPTYLAQSLDLDRIVPALAVGRTNAGVAVYAAASSGIRR